jgi:hypothetical protein
MGIFRALGLGLAIIIIRFLVPELFDVIKDTLLLFFDVLQGILSLGNLKLTSSTYSHVSPNDINNLLPINW